MKIYFSASISQMDEKAKQDYLTIVQTLENLGHKVIADHVIKTGKNGYSNQDETESLSAQSKLTKWKKQADLVVVEASRKSFGIGQEIALALANSKPVIALYQDDMKPHLLRDGTKDLLLLVEYDSENLKKVLKEAIEYASEQRDTRFNFFIGPNQLKFLDDVSKERRIPRSVFLRRLIEVDMRENAEYSGE